MKEESAYQPDYGALLSARVRALEWEKPPQERICEDPYARALIGEEGMEMGRQIEESDHIVQLGKIVPSVQNIVLLRTRYTDEYLKRGIAQGARQIVILGAGFDSRALRLKEAQSTRIFEVDRPIHMEEKKKRVRALLGELSPHVVYIGIDFLAETLEDLKRKLVERGYDLQGKSLYLMEGLVSHLTHESVSELFRFISANSGKGSFLVCTYPHEDMAAGLEQIRAGSEPTFGLNPPQMAEFLAERGFGQIKNLTLDEAHSLYHLRAEGPIPYSFVEAIVV